MDWDGDIMIPAQPIRGPQNNKADQSESRYLPCLLSMAGNFHSMKRTEFYLMGFIVIQVPKRLTGNANKYKTNSRRSLATVFSLPVTVIKPFRSFSFTFVKTEKNPSDIYITPAWQMSQNIELSHQKICIQENALYVISVSPFLFAL